MQIKFIKEISSISYPLNIIHKSQIEYISYPSCKFNEKMAKNKFFFYIAISTQ